MSIGQVIVTQLAETFKAKKKKDREDRALESNVNHASALGWLDDCPRHLVLMRLAPEKEVKTEDFDYVTEEGHHQETILLNEMAEAGIVVEPAEMMEMPDYKLKGQADGIVVEEGERFPLDGKSCSAQMFREISHMSGPDDLMASKAIWLRHYPAQMLSYIALYGHPRSVLLFRNKENGKKHAIDVSWSSTKWKPYADGLLAINEAVKKEDLPPVINNDAICRPERCGFCETMCYTNGDAPKALIQVVDDDELRASIERQLELAPFNKEYEKLYEANKEYFGKDAGTWRIGDIQVTNKPYNTTIYDLPADIKAKYAKASPRSRFSFKNLAGSL
jgi:hypothetical protein